MLVQLEEVENAFYRKRHASPQQSFCCAVTQHFLPQETVARHYNNQVQGSVHIIVCISWRYCQNYNYSSPPLGFQAQIPSLVMLEKT